MKVFNQKLNDLMNKTKELYNLSQEIENIVNDIQTIEEFAPVRTYMNYIHLKRDLGKLNFKLLSKYCNE